MSKIKVSIIIVYYQDKKSLFNCLNSIDKNKPSFPFEVIVVDNDEVKTVERELKSRFNWIKYKKASGNIGYGAGNNLGASMARGEFLMILNPDTLVKPKSIDNLVDFLDENKDVAIVAPNLVDSKGKIFAQLGSRELTPLRGIFALSFLNKFFPHNRISREYWLKDLPLDKKREVDVVPGSAFLIRKDVFQKVGGFDENIFLFFEESDLGRRVRKIGYKLFIIPQSQIIHFWSGGKNDPPLMKGIFRKSRFYYFRKHFGLFPAILVEIFARFSKRAFMFIPISIFLIILVLIILGLLSRS